MQFSIFSVPFKCSKDMFTWEKIKWSICVYWAQAWRGGSFGLAMGLLGVAVLMAPEFLDPETLAQYSGPELGVDGLSQLMIYWRQHLFVPGIVFVCCWVMGLIFMGVYIQYYATFKKNYRSLSRQFNKSEVGRFWSRGFWKPFILITLFGLFLGFVESFVLELIGTPKIFVTLTGFVVGLVLFHIFIHGGSWGFVPVRKGVKTEVLEIKS
jgi:hypothetical protein